MFQYLLGLQQYRSWQNEIIRVVQLDIDPWLLAANCGYLDIEHHRNYLSWGSHAEPNLYQRTQAELLPQNVGWMGRPVQLEPTPSTPLWLFFYVKFFLQGLSAHPILSVCCFSDYGSLFTHHPYGKPNESLKPLVLFYPCVPSAQGRVWSRIRCSGFHACLWKKYINEHLSGRKRESHYLSPMKGLYKIICWLSRGFP